MEPYGRVAPWALLLAASACGRTDLDSSGPASGGGGGVAGIVLAATTDLTDVVRLTWTASPDVARGGFRVVRDGGDAATVSGTIRGFDDVAADPGHVSPPEALTATQGTRSDGVALAWSAASATSGRTHAYRVIALDESRSPVKSSNLAAGARAAPMITGYEVARDDGDWSAIGSATTAVDEEAPVGTIVAEAEATPRYPGAYTRLRVVREPTITPPGPSMYRVRVATSAGASAPSAPAAGFRGVGDVVSYQWERSTGDVDAGYAPQPEVAGALWFDAVSSVGRGWYYRAVMSASGAAGQTAGARAAVLGFRSISAGGTFACGVRFDDTVLCWGRTPDSVAGAEFPAGPWPGTFKSVSAGTDHACAIRAADDTILCWGGDNQPDPSTDRFKSISDRCAVRLDDKVVCWGDNARGEAPPGPSADSFQSVSNVCGVRLDGRMVCWGDNSDGGAPPGPSRDRFKSISSSSGGFGCGVRVDDKVVCWGNNQDGQAPAGPSADSFQSVATGAAFACGVRADGRVICWGNNSSGQAPPGPSADTFKSVSAGQYGHYYGFVCGVRTDDRVVCWGYNEVGQAPPLPRQESFTSVSAGGGTVCAIRSDDKLVCWADNASNGQAPPGPSSSSFKSVSAGQFLSCAVRSDDKVVCWGDTAPFSEDAPPTPADSFRSVSAGRASDPFACGVRWDDKIACWAGLGVAGAVPSDSFRSVSVGARHVCGVRMDGRLLCWGDNIAGEAPSGPSADLWKTVSASQYVSELGGGFTCGLRGDDKMVCFGGPGQNRAAMDQFPLGPSAESFKAVSAGNYGTCGVRADDRVVCWGYFGDPGQTTFPSLDRFLDVSVGSSFACGLRADRRLVCWGRQHDI